MKTLTLDEAAVFLKTTPETVSAMIRGHGLPAVKVGRAYVLVDEDVVEWLRERYECGSTSAPKARRGLSISGIKAGELEKALARGPGKKRRNTPTALKRNSGEPPDSANVLPLRGTQRS